MSEPSHDNNRGVVTTAHGSGGVSTSELIRDVFAAHFHNEILDRMEDSPIVPGSGRIAVTTDSFVVRPIFFPGGDLGRLCVCGTVNDLLMSGSVPQYLTCGCILEEGCPIEDLDRVIASMAETAEEAGVKIITGDTKVVESTSKEPGLIINTAGVGFAREGISPGPFDCKPGDVILLSGTLGDHHATILGSRLGIQNGIRSDAAPLGEMVGALMHEAEQGSIQVHAMRDVTRGGLATVLNEFAESSRVTIHLEEEKLPVSAEVRDFCGLLGLDPLFMGNEGKMVAVVPEESAELALSRIRESRYGQDAVIIGRISEPEVGNGEGRVILHTQLGGERIVGRLYGEGLPRIC